MIRANDRIATILERDESLIDAFVAISPAFERLRNPAMRRVMAKIVTVEQAARVAGIDVRLLLARLNLHAGNTAGNSVKSQPVGSASLDPVATLPGDDALRDLESGSEQHSSNDRPLALRRVPADSTVVLDVREELRAGREPFSMIMAALRTVPEDGALCVRAIFEPVPLYAVMRRHQLAHWTDRRADDDWLVWFYPEHAAGAAPEAADAPAGSSTSDVADSEDDVVILDVRGLEPPEPMIRTLAALEQLPEGATLVQLNVRVPQFLLPLLEERGFTYEVREQDADLVRMFIRRSPS